jgi:CheY-like chemotaxis protein/nitrogen-specific signal transduction histidine kinase
MPKSKTARVRRRTARKPAAARKARSAGAAPGRLSDAALAAFAHEIRTPLTGILACAELLATSGLPERERGWVAAIKSNAEHLTTLTTLAVDAARADAVGLPLRRDVFQPRGVAAAVAESMKARAEAKGLKASFVVRGRLPALVSGDAARLRAALENLIDNAVKFTERGRVRLEASAQPAARGRQRLTFAVSDTGVGLTPAEIKRLFRPFARGRSDVAERFGGSGLGLAFVKAVARAMGGDLRVSSAGPRGTTFQLDIMVQPVAATRRASGDHPASPRIPSVRGLTVLCAEDNPYGRVVLNTILGELGHVAEFVGSGEAAVEAVGRGRYDVLLIDLVLSGIDGLEAARRIRALAGPPSRIPIVGISGRAELADRAQTRSAGMDAFLPKPLSPSALAQVFGTLCSAR